jgi:para-aminobenzoate synthetase component I
MGWALTSNKAAPEARLVTREIPFCDPAAAFARFSAAPFAAFLDSADQSSDQGRFSYILSDPFRILSAGEHVSVDGQIVPGDPFSVLARELARFRNPQAGGAAPFCGGAVGFIGYEAGRHLERLPEPKPDDMNFPEMFMGFYDTVVAFDMSERRAFIMADRVCEKDQNIVRPEAEERIDLMADMIASAPKEGALDETLSASWRAEMTREAYEEKVRRVIEYIHAGDVFQVNLSQRFLGELPSGLSSFDLYRRLRKQSPAPFSAYLSCGEGSSLASASPELFLRLYGDGRIETRPIKGTRPRGATDEKDRALAELLMNSEKDRAENLMIVDLLRNDLSKVCDFGSIEVSKMFGLESFANVHHLVSVVEGRCRENVDAVALLKAAFPGGSITGAPKIRAMEIISELECARRGPYCGSVCWLGFDGTMQASIIIRTLAVSKNKVVAQAGGGIVSDSDPAEEYDESLVKAAALLASLDPSRSYP